LARFLALDGDHPQLQVVVGTVHKGKVRVERALTLAEEQPINPATAAGIGRRLRERLREAGVAPAPLLACLGRERVILKEVRHPAVPPVEEAALIRFQAVKDLTDAADEVVIDYMAGAGGPGEERRSLAVVLRKDLLKAYQALAEAAGLKLAALTPRSFGAGAVLATALEPPPADAAVAVLVRGERWGEFSVLHNGHLLLSRTLPAPALATDTALLGEVRRNLAVYAAQQPHHPIRALYVVETPGITDLSGRLRDVLSVPVHPIDPLAGLADAPPGPRGGFAGPVGLLTMRAKGGELPVNFVHPREPKPPADPNRKPLTYAAAAVALLVAVSGAFGYMQVSQRGRTLAGLRAQKDGLDQQLLQLKSETDRGKEIDAWQAGQVVWLDELYDLTDRVRDIDRLRVTELIGQSGDFTGKSKSPAKMEVKGALATADDRPLNDLVAEYVKDPHTKFKRKDMPEVRGRNRPFAQQFSVTLEVDRLAPEKYIRQFTAKPPEKRRDRGGDGGGFGEFGGPFGGMGMMGGPP
jgi:hypothetical protein